MQINHNRRKCVSVVVSGLNIATLLFIVIDVCIASSSHEYELPNNTLLNGSNIAPNESVGKYYVALFQLLNQEDMSVHLMILLAEEFICVF